MCRRHFGVFVDIGFGTGACGVLLVPEFHDAHIRRYDFDDYPLVGDKVTALVRRISLDQHAIALTQKQSFDPETEAWTEP